MESYSSLKEKCISPWDQALPSSSCWIGFSRGARLAIINALLMKRKDHLSSSIDSLHMQMQSFLSFQSKPWQMPEKSRETWPGYCMQWNEFNLTVISPPFWLSTRSWPSVSCAPNSKEPLGVRSKSWGINTQWRRFIASLTSSNMEWTWKATVTKGQPTSSKMRKTSSPSTYLREHSETLSHASFSCWPTLKSLRISK